MTVMHPTELHGPFRKRLDAFSRELKDVEDGDVGALHRTRVASRRLREVVPLLELDGDVSHRLSRRLRKVTRALGPVRELDVLMLLIQELEANDRYPPTALKHVAATVAQGRAAARERLSAKSPTSKLQRLARALEHASQRLQSADTESNRLKTKRSRRAWEWALDARVARRGGCLGAAIEAAGTAYAAGPLHAVRIAVKRLRYAAELAAEAMHTRIGADLAVLKTMQNRLGRLHDLQVLLVRARETQVSASLTDLAVWRELGALVRVVEDDCRTLHARYMSDRAALMAVANRMGARTPDARLIARRPAV